ncbi:hypothetical protein G3545_12365 [Starkeya sp. ORNL1]|uniref:hypothetical protein n=1 Tax=Starkeya sp. ORNL1 TaxID=2709380 RepID=UPI001462C7BC|nr:hypothetical protein [Starkeya sp. ORNL1]QJP14366.1 hypothetical protein G3545_12365 [Starkeya sp. ORNL1]
MLDGEAGCGRLYFIGMASIARRGELVFAGDALVRFLLAFDPVCRTGAFNRQSLHNFIFSVGRERKTAVEIDQLPNSEFVSFHIQTLYVFFVAWNFIL